VLSVPATELEAALLDASAELAGAIELAANELAGVELGAKELGATELAAVELGTGDGAGLLPPPPPPPQAVKLMSTTGRAQVLIRDCMIIQILRFCYRGNIMIANVTSFKRCSLKALSLWVIWLFLLTSPKSVHATI
jgi:hypothetical protein